MRGVVIGMVVGGASVLMLGVAGQPASRKADEVVARLDRLEAAILKPGSTLPQDPNRSIESMLDELLASSREVERQVARLDDAKLDALAGRVRTIYDSLLNVKVAQITDINRRLDDIERQFVVLGPTGRLDDLVRDVEALQRTVEGDVERALRDNERQIEAATRETQRLERRVSRVEAKIR